MYLTADDIEKEISLYYLIDNRNANKKVGLIRAYFVFSFYKGFSVLKGMKTSTLRMVKR